MRLISTEKMLRDFKSAGNSLAFGDRTREHLRLSSFSSRSLIEFDSNPLRPHQTSETKAEVHGVNHYLKPRTSPPNIDERLVRLPKGFIGTGYQDLGT